MKCTSLQIGKLDIKTDDAKGKNDGSVGTVHYFKCSKKKGLFVKASGIEKTNAKRNPSAPRVTVGDTVRCTKQKCNGTIRFIGTPYSVKKEGTYYGMELDKPKGKNNGTVKGRWYFSCKDKFGCFVQATGFTVNGKAVTSKKKKIKKKSKKSKHEEPEEKEREIPSTDITPSNPSTESIKSQNRKTDVVDTVNNNTSDTVPSEIPKEEEHGEWKSLRTAFKSMDSDGNMSIDRQEFSNMAQEVFKCNMAESETLFTEIDINKSGSISFAEFDAFIKRIGAIENVKLRIAALCEKDKENVSEVDDIDPKSTSDVTSASSSAASSASSSATASEPVIVTTTIEDEKEEVPLTEITESNMATDHKDDGSELSVDDGAVSEVNDINDTNSNGVDEPDKPQFDDDNKAELMKPPNHLGAPTVDETPILSDYQVTDTDGQSDGMCPIMFYQ